MASIRTFIALPIAASALPSILVEQTKLQKIGAQAVWEKMEQVHITLKFLGDLEEQQIDSFNKVIGQAVQSFSPLDLTIHGIGAFPKADFPKIVWIGVQPHSVLFQLQQSIENTVATLGISKETRAYHPHITLGRVKGTKNIHRLTEAIKTSTFEPIQIHCQEVLFMKSDLYPDGAVYTKLKSFLLQN